MSQFALIRTIFGTTVALAALSGLALWHWPGLVAQMRSVFQAPISSINQLLVPTPATVFGTSQLRILAVGLDYDYDKLDQETSQSSRSDIIMAFHVDLLHHHISELSIPRDMIATLPNGKQAKINEAQSEGGIKESQEVIAKWLGIPNFNRYIVLRIDATKDLITALGGVDVNVKNSDALKAQGANGPIDYDDNWGHLHVHLKPGLQHLNGEQAVGYARFRHDWCSDPCRIMRQQQVIQAITHRIEHDSVNTMLHAQQLLAVLNHDVDTNLTTQEELSLILTFARISANDIHMAQVPYTGSVQLPDYGDSLIPDEAMKQQLVTAFMGDSPQAGRPIRVCLENGTTIPGLAARVGQQLASQGFIISEIRNAPRSNFVTTEVHGLSGQLDAETKLRETLNLPITPSNGTSGYAEAPLTHNADVIIVLGRDLMSAEVSPTPGPTASP